MLEKFDKFVHKNDEIVLILNNLGGCTDIEMGILLENLYDALKLRFINILRIVSGRIMTSLEMQGFNITICRVLPDLKEKLLKYIDLDTGIKSWHCFIPP